MVNVGYLDEENKWSRIIDLYRFVDGIWPVPRRNPGPVFALSCCEDSPAEMRAFLYKALDKYITTINVVLQSLQV